jgi:pilus assembly protein CpaE
MRESLKRMLQFEPDLELVGDAADGEQGVEGALRLKPDVVLMDINLPRKDGITATTDILKVAPCNVVMLSVEGDQEYLRRAMQAGARDYLVKPFSSRELVAAIHRAYEVGCRAGSLPVAAAHRGTVIAVFGTKGGVGKTTLAANLAVGLAGASGKPVALADFDLEFGDQAALLGVKPASSILNLCRGDERVSGAMLDKAVAAAPGPADVFLLAAPPAPELAAEVEGEGKRHADRNYAAEVLSALAERYPLTVVDTSSSFREATLAALDRADVILMLTGVDLPALQKAGKGLDILLDRLEYPRSKLRLVVNEYGAMPGLTMADISQGLDCPVWATLPADPKNVAWAANYGKPFVLSRRDSPAARAVLQMAARLLAETGAAGAPAAGAAGARAAAAGAAAAGGAGQAAKGRRQKTQPGALPRRGR